MPQTTDRRDSSLTAALWLAAGAAAGVIVGVVLADRFGGGRKLLKRFDGVLRTVNAWAAAPQAGADDEDEDDAAIEDENDVEYEDEDDDDDEDDDEDAVASGGAPKIDERVLAAFDQDPLLSQRAIEIDEPEPATIVLTGRVPDAKDAKHAVIIALGVPGVARVENRLHIGKARPAH